MQLVLAGTFNKKDMELFERRKKEEMAKKERSGEVKKEEQIVRVKARSKRKL